MSEILANRRSIIGGGLAAGAAILSGSAPRPLRAQGVEARADDLAWGVNGHPFTAYPGISAEEQLDLVRSLGFSQYRINLQPDGSADRIEEMLPLAKDRGIDLLPILHPEGSMDDLSARELAQRAYETGLRMSRRFQGRVPVWELSNELENYAIIKACETRFDGTKYPCDWGPAGGVGVLDYHPGRWTKVSAILKGLSRGVKAGDPAARRALGTAGWGHLGAYERMAADGIEWDITVWHDYAGVPESSLAFLARFGKPIWITEFNADVGGDPPLSPEQQAEGLKARIAYYRALRTRYRIEAAHVYELLDETYWGDTFEARMGLVTIEKTGDSWKLGELKPAGLVVREALTGT